MNRLSNTEDVRVDRLVDLEVDNPFREHLYLLLLGSNGLAPRDAEKVELLGDGHHAVHASFRLGWETARRVGRQSVRDHHLEVDAIDRPLAVSDLAELEVPQAPDGHVNLVRRVKADRNAERTVDQHAAERREVLLEVRS